MGEVSDNLYVTNLPGGLDESMVMQFFSIYGTVTSVKVLPNPMGLATGRCAALVRFASIVEATSIQQTLHGTVPTGLDEPVQVKFATKKGAGKAGGGMSMSMGMAPGTGGYGMVGSASAANMASPYASAKGGGKGEPQISDNIYVQGLPAGSTEESLQDTFKEFGTIQSLRLLPSRGPGAPCAALIRYCNVEAAQMTKEILNGQTPEGFPSPLIVRFANAPGSNVVSPMAPVDSGMHSMTATGAAGAAGESGFQPQVVGLTCAAMVDMVYQSDMLPGGRRFSNERASLYVAGLPSDAKETHLYKMFSPYGAIHTCNVKIQGNAEYSWAIGFVNYMDPLNAEAAITAYNGMSLPDGSQLKVTIKTRPAGK